MNKIAEENIVNIIKNITLKNKGGTFIIKNNNIINTNKGFIAGIPATEVKCEIIHIDVCIKNYLEHLENINNTLIGTWIHDGMLYMNQSIIFDSEIEAIKYCMENDLLAYYDAEHCDVIFLKGEIVK